MASLIEDLINTLEKENTEYTELLNISKEKATTIVNGDVERLQELLVLEQASIDKLNELDENRASDVQDICRVLNLSPKDIKIDNIIQILEKKPEEHDALQAVQSRLKRTLAQLMKLNENNKILLKESMDMIEFELNLAKNAIVAPQTANYGKGAYEQDTLSSVGRFDAKQ